jgi:N-acetylmuramoyl-L-alanine amidase
VLDCRTMPRARVTALCAALLLAVALFAGALPPAGGVARAADPLAFTIRTIDNEAGVRVVMEFSRKPIYEVRGDGRRVYVTLREPDTKAPFKKKDYGGALLERIKFVEGFRTSEIVFYTGPDFGTFSTFEMGEPFRLVLDLRRAPSPHAATRVGETPGAPPAAPPEAGHAAPAPGAAPGMAPPAGGARPPAGGPAPGGAPEAAPAAAPPAPHRADFVVVVDAGHGGDEEGARGPTGLQEKDVTLDIARRLRGLLAGDEGTEVILTRDEDRRVALDDRTAIANHARADLFVSIHCNSSPRDSAMGSETYFLSYQATDDDARALAALENNALQIDKGVSGQSGLDLVLWDLAQSAYLKESSDLAERIQDRLNDALGVRNRGIKQAPFRVLMGATMPAVLVEVAFISSPAEEQRLRQASFKDKIAASIADSVRAFRKKVAR